MSAPPKMPPVLAGNLRPENIARAIRLCQALDSDHHVPLFQAAAASRIAMTALADRLSRPNMNALNKAKRPAIILVGDDDDACTGPLGWAATDQVLGWSRAAVVHATGGDRASYAMAVLLAETYGRLALIETSSGAADAWIRALVRANVATVHLKPTGDGVHPVYPEQEAAP
ncbi:MAG: hypothetical protein ACRYHQ_19130 [Janthinobacterium lividum]